MNLLMVLAFRNVTIFMCKIPPLLRSGPESPRFFKKPGERTVAFRLSCFLEEQMYYFPVVHRFLAGFEMCSAI
jgi:hypothetical protein